MRCSRREAALQVLHTSRQTRMNATPVGNGFIRSYLVSLAEEGGAANPRQFRRGRVTRPVDERGGNPLPPSLREVARQRHDGGSNTSTCGEVVGEGLRALPHYPIKRAHTEVRPYGNRLAFVGDDTLSSSRASVCGCGRANARRREFTRKPMASS